MNIGQYNEKSVFGGHPSGHVLEAVHVGEQPYLLHYIQVGGVDQDPAETQLLCRGALHLPVRHHQHVGGESH